MVSVDGASLQMHEFDEDCNLDGEVIDLDFLWFFFPSFFLFFLSQNMEIRSNTNKCSDLICVCRGLSQSRRNNLFVFNCGAQHLVFQWQTREKMFTSSQLTGSYVKQKWKSFKATVITWLPDLCGSGLNTIVTKQISPVPYTKNGLIFWVLILFEGSYGLFEDCCCCFVTG